MKDESFERTMEAWAEQEQAAAPVMRPTDEMYRLVEAQRERRGLFAAGLRRWARLGATIASVLLVALAYTQLYRPPAVVGPRLAIVRLREAFPTEKGRVVTQTPAARGQTPKGELAFFVALELQVRSAGVEAITSLDLRQPLDEPIALAASDSYRLVLQLQRDGHVYVYQQAPSGVALLFPNEAYADAANPLRKGETYLLPQLPLGFYVEAGAGEQRLHVVASAEPLEELSQAYEGYATAPSAAARHQALSTVLQTLDGIEAAHPGSAVRWTLEFSVQ